MLLVSVAISVMLAAAPEDETVIAGATLAEWRTRMNGIDLADPASSHWVPGLIAVMETESAPWFTRRQAALTLGRMQGLARDAVPVLRTHLDDVGKDPDTSPQLWALKALALFGAVAKDATPDIVRVLQSPATSFPARFSAIDALSQIGPDHPLVIPTLIEFARDDTEPALRRGAIEALGYNGPAAASALPVLVRALDDADENLRREAATSLGKLGPQGESAQFALLERLVFDDIPAVQDAAATALSTIGPAVGLQLLPLLESDEAETRRRTATIFGSWRSNARAWQAAIEHLWDDPSPAVRLAALDASWQITRNGDAIAPRIAGLLTDDDRQLRIAAARLLMRMGPAARSAVKLLQQLARHERPEVRLAAGKVLQEIEE